MAATFSSGLLSRQLEEIQLIQCSLLPTELFSFILQSDNDDEWSALLQEHSSGETRIAKRPSSPCRFRVKIYNVPLYFELELPIDYPHTVPLVFVRGDTIQRQLQEQWQRIVADKLSELLQEDTEYAFACHCDTYVF